MYKEVHPTLVLSRMLELESCEILVGFLGASTKVEGFERAHGYGILQPHSDCKVWSLFSPLGPPFTEQMPL
jgi:hypothetical protein